MRKADEVTNEELYKFIYHWKIEDRLSWNFCSEILKQNYDIEIDKEELEKRIKTHMKDKLNLSKGEILSLLSREF